MKNLSALKLSCTKTFGRTGLILKKHSPEILTGIGVVGVITSAVLAAKATLKLDDIVTDIQSDLVSVEDARVTVADRYSDQDALKDRTTIYTKGVMNIGKLYGPSVSLGLASIGCILAAHGIMQKRNAALVVAYKTIEESFNRYKARVVEELGEDQERDIRFGITEEEVVGEDGKRSLKKVIADNTSSPYARFFDEYSIKWERDAAYNLTFLKCQQNWANDKLKARGHIFLNEVYDMLGLPHTQAGSIVGWVMGENGDEFVDFNMYDFESDEARAFINGEERSILLDFNVDGVIFDKI